MMTKNIYVVIGREYHPELVTERFVIATYSNYEAALAHAKRFVDDVLEVRSTKGRTYVHGKDAEADVEMFPLKRSLTMINKNTYSVNEVWGDACAAWFTAHDSIGYSSQHQYIHDAGYKAGFDAGYDTARILYEGENRQ